MLAVHPNLLRSPTLLARARQHRKDKSMPLRGDGLDAPLTRPARRQCFAGQGDHSVIARSAHPPATASPILAALRTEATAQAAAARSCRGPRYWRAHRAQPSPGLPGTPTPRTPQAGPGQCAVGTKARTPATHETRQTANLSSARGGSPPGPSGCTLSRAAEAGRLALEKISVWPPVRLHSRRQAQHPSTLLRPPPSAPPDQKPDQPVTEVTPVNTVTPFPPCERKSHNPRAQVLIRFVRDCHEGCFPAPDTRAVIHSASPLPYPAGAGTLGTRVPAASRLLPQSIRRPGSLKITASCAQRPVVPVTVTACSGCPPAPPASPRTARASPSRILHASPSLRTVISDWARADRKENTSAQLARAIPLGPTRHLADRRFQVFCRFVLPLLHGGPVSRPSPARFLTQGARAWCPPKIPPRAALMRGLIRVKGERPDRAAEHKKTP